MNGKIAKAIRKKVYGKDMSRTAQYEILWRKVLRWVTEPGKKVPKYKTIRRGQVVSTGLRAIYKAEKKLYKKGITV